MLTREYCGRCNHVSAVGFYVPDDTWRKVAGRHWADSILCVRCFAELGDDKLVAWDDVIVFYPVSLAAHQKWLSENTA